MAVMARRIQGASDDVATEIGEGMVEVFNISGEAADDGTLAAGARRLE